jgi:murein DD-endopeptidase MepM/ murein hydrolase activator NlpD
MVSAFASLLWALAPIAPPEPTAFSNFDFLNNLDLAAATASDRACGAAELELTLDWRMELPPPEISYGLRLLDDGEWSTYEQIPRREDRPSDYERYRYPVSRFISWPRVVYGYDLDAPSEQQRQGLHAVGPVKVVALAQQVGEAEVVYIGPLFGNSVVTRHTLREGGGKHDYIVIYGHLSETPKTLTFGAHVADGEVIGSVGDSGSPNMVHLHLEARRLRDGVDARRLYRDAFIAQSIVTDPRNVLPVAAPEPRRGQCASSKVRLQLRPMRLALEDVRQPDVRAFPF